MIFDLHCDTVWKIRDLREKGQNLEMTASSELQLDQAKMKEGNYFAQCFALWVHARHGDPYAIYRDLLRIYREELAKCKDFQAAYTYNDLLENQKNGKISSMLSMEDSAPVGCSLDRLQELYDDGVRMICLTWNYPNAVGYPNFGRYFENGEPDRLMPDTVNGLTDFGREMVREMNRLGMVIDVSHLSDAGFYDVISLSEKPIAASHSNARALCNVARNMSDDMLYRLAENGGVVGMNYAAGFLDRKNGCKTVQFVIEHVCVIFKIALAADAGEVPETVKCVHACIRRLVVKQGISSLHHIRHVFVFIVRVGECDDAYLRHKIVGRYRQILRDFAAYGLRKAECEQHRTAHNENAEHCTENTADRFADDCKNFFHNEHPNLLFVRQLPYPFIAVDFGHRHGTFGDLVAFKQKESDGNRPLKHKCRQK